MLFANYLFLVAKGMAMGAANVIPGVSGGTIAFITGIYEQLIRALKSFDLRALALLVKFRIAAFLRHVDFYFLLAIGVGVALSIIGLAKIVEYLFTQYPVYLWSYLFGLIFVSVFFVGREISKWSVLPVFSLIVGTAAAIWIVLVSPGSENTATWYLFLCGMVAVCSMIVPGLSGSFVLLVMGNYLLILKAISALDFSILVPFAAGCVVGLLAFSHLLFWLLSRFRETTLALLTGFVLGSLCLIWPWKKDVYLTDAFGILILKPGKDAPIKTGYEYYFPEWLSAETLLAFFFLLGGILTVYLIERLAKTGSVPALKTPRA